MMTSHRNNQPLFLVSAVDGIGPTWCHYLLCRVFVFCHLLSSSNNSSRVKDRALGGDSRRTVRTRNTTWSGCRQRDTQTFRLLNRNFTWLHTVDYWLILRFPSHELKHKRYKEESAKHGCRTSKQNTSDDGGLKMFFQRNSSTPRMVE